MTSVPELSLGAQVLATDGELGTLRALIVDAATGSISHLAVTNGEVPNSARLIAMRHVSQADAHQAQLDMSRREALRCPRLVVPGTVPDSADQGRDETASAWFLDLSAGEYTFALRRRLPTAESVLVTRGRPVESVDGDHLGVIDDVVIDVDTGAISHLVLAKGHLFGRRQVLIPASRIVEISADHIRADLSPSSLETTMRRHTTRT